MRRKRYLKHQYTTVFKVFLVVFILLLIIAFGSGGKMLSQFTPFAFLTGGIWSMLAGFIGMKIATNSNARTAQAASESLNKGLRVAFSSGSVMGFTVVGLGMLDITIWFFLLRYAFGINDPVSLGNIMVMNGMGASFMALFARVGGGIYTKAADVGADWWAKLRPESPRTIPGTPPPSPTMWATTWAMWPAWARTCMRAMWLYPGNLRLGRCGRLRLGRLLLPVALAVCGIICSIIGSFLVKTKENATQQSLLKSLRTGTYTAAVLSAILAAPLTYFILDGHMGVYVAILCGLIGAAPSATSPSITPLIPISPLRSWRPLRDRLRHHHHRRHLPGSEVHSDLHPDRGGCGAGQLLRRRRQHGDRG